MKALYTTAEQFITDLVTLGVEFNVRRPGTARIAKNALYVFTVATPALAKEIEHLVNEYNTVRTYTAFSGETITEKRSPLHVARQGQPLASSNSSAIDVLVWGFKPVYARRSR